MIEWVAIVFVSIVVLTDLLLIFLWQVNFKEANPILNELPSVDILIAARNEEENIQACIDSLLSLDYPKDKLTIWLGDDDSTDTTWQSIQSYASKHHHIIASQITKQSIIGNGKANVLAQLARKGKGDWIFITDADINVPNNWIKAMLAGADKENALITGTSLVVGDSWLATFQRLDWLYATSMLKVISDLDIPVTTMGNNMAITRSAYYEVGGFEGLPFSVTEDLEIFKAVKKKHSTINLFSKEVLNRSTPQQSFMDLLLQRKRWMRGAFELPFELLSILLLQAFYLPAIITLVTINPLVGLLFWLGKWLTKYIFNIIAAKKLEEKVSLFDSFVTECYLMFFSVVSVLYYFWPGKIYWKGRTY
jgi:cellulose synthase/poly-beta-1,6-N-acetylglucosamine synthase-like glycosyltransferase